MSVALGLGLGLFVLTAVASVLTIGLVSGYRNTVALLNEKAELIVSAEVHQTLRYLESAQAEVDFVAQYIARENINPGPDEEFVTLMLGAMAATPHIVRLQFVGVDGRLAGAEREENAVSPIFQSVRGDADLRTRIAHVETTGEAYWGAPIWRQEFDEAFLNYHQPVMREGRHFGTVTALVSTRRLSESVADLETSFGANAFILYGREAVLAHPLLAFGYSGLTRLAPFPVQERFADPVIASLWDEQRAGTLEQRVLAREGIRFIDLGPQSYVVLYQTLAGYADRELHVGTYLPSSDLLAEVDRLRWAIILCIAISALSAITAALIGRNIARPVRRLAEGSKRIHDLDLEHVERIPGSFFRELNDAATSFNVMLEGLRWFERYVPKSIVQRLIRIYQERGIDTVHRDVVILFTDIEGFTALSEQMPAPVAADFLNAHFALVADCVEATGGTIDKFIGDSVMAFWGAPETYSDAADRACKAALAIERRIVARNRESRETGDPIVRLRIGIHRGDVIVGNIGSPGRINYTVVGDPANVANRLSEVGRTRGGGGREVMILLSAQVRTSLRGAFALDSLGPQPLRGRREKVEVFSLAPATADAKDATVPPVFEI